MSFAAFLLLVPRSSGMQALANGGRKMAVAHVRPSRLAKLMEETHATQVELTYLGG